LKSKSQNPNKPKTHNPKKEAANPAKKITVWLKYAEINTTSDYSSSFSLLKDFKSTVS
jgi:hypothetical protein